MKRWLKNGFWALGLLIIFNLSACASVQSPLVEQQTAAADQAKALDTQATRAAAIRQASIDAGDPYERFNRSIYQFNSSLDNWILRPIAKSYVEYIPQPIRNSVGHFFSNLWEPNTLINALLQGKGTAAANSTGRFLLNSTIGLLGIFDVASPMGLPKQKEDFGQTLAVWGVSDGPYLMLPLFGPSSLRDLGGLIVQTFSTDLIPPLFDGSEQWAATGMRVIDTRMRLLGADETLALQVDPYLFLRESYRQARVLEINDGVPLEAEEDPFEASLFE